MGTVTRNGKNWKIRVYLADGKQTGFQFAGSKTNADHAERQIETLNSCCKANKKPPGETLRWFNLQTKKLQAKLIEKGLAEDWMLPDSEQDPADQMGVRLHAFLQENMDLKLTVKNLPAKKGTTDTWKATNKRLQEFFADDPPIKAITKERAFQYFAWLQTYIIKGTKTPSRNGNPLKANTKTSDIRTVTAFFNKAKNRGLVLTNPFEGISTSYVAGEQFYIDIPMMEKLMKVMPDDDFRLVLALWRLGGLRHREVFLLQWDFVDWQQQTLLVKIPKTQHHKGKAERLVPLRDLASYLKVVLKNQGYSAKKKPPKGSMILPRWGSLETNLFIEFEGFVVKAGLEPWPRLIQNLRSSCETWWLNKGVPPHVAAAWAGHTVKVQTQSYAQIAAGHFGEFNATDPEDQVVYKF